MNDVALWALIHYKNKVYFGKKIISQVEMQFILKREIFGLKLFIT